MERRHEIQNELLETFKALLEDQLVRLNSYLMDLEKHPAAERREDLYRKIYREYHNIKGSAGTVRQTDVMDLTHELEDILELMRKKQLEETVQLFDLHYESLDAISLMIRCRLNGEELPDDVFQGLRRRIERARSGFMQETGNLDSSMRRLGKGMGLTGRQAASGGQAGRRCFLRKGNRHG